MPMSDRLPLLLVSIVTVGAGLTMIVRSQKIASKMRDRPSGLLGESGRKVAAAQRGGSVVGAGVAFVLVGAIGAAMAIAGLLAETQY